MTGSGDQTVRQRALSAEGSFIVRAPAGSGKTELLIQRYLNLLAQVREPEEIIAITFTRKAAAEMRERIVDALRRAAAGRDDAAGMDAKRLELAAAAVTNDGERGWGIVDHPSRLQIQTIDALCLSLTRQLPYLSGFSAPSGILEDAGAVYRRAATGTIRLLGGPNRSWRDALTRFLAHTDNDVSRAVGLIAAMLASRDQWLRHVGETDVAADDLQNAWRGIIESALADAGRRFPEHLKASMVECAGAAAAELASSSTGAQAWLTGEGFPAPRADELPRWRFIANLLVKKTEPVFRERVNRNDGFAPRTEAKLAMELLLADLAGEVGLAIALDSSRSLPDPRFDPAQAGVLGAMVKVLKLAVAQLQLIFQETGEVDFVEVTQRAIAALGALEDPSDLALKLDYQIQHLLVDEFQDTSIAQYRLLELLTQGWAPGDGKTLFLVGDPTQSIYRFREAEVGVFLDVWEQGLGSVPLEALRLRSNFRSSPRIVEWINGAFSLCFPAVPDPQSGAVAYEESLPRVADDDDDARVYVHPFLDSSEPAQAERLAVLVGEALERSRDVAVLVRARSHLKDLLPALEARNIPYSGMDITALVNEPVVRDLYNLTRALLHPGDRLAWLSLLRGPWCGLVLRDLLAVAGSGRTLVWDALEDPAVRSRVSADGARRIDRVVNALRGAVEQRGRLAVRQWVRRAWTSLSGPAFSDPAGLEHAEAYFALVERHQSGMHLVDDAAFTGALESHFAHSEARAGAVQIMTIHKAKGLEFDEVFLPGLDRSPSTDDKRLLLWEEPAAGQGLLLASLSAPGAPDDGHYRFLRALQARKTSNEDDRVLYVACTRARRRLHLLANLSTRDGAPSPPGRGTLLRRIWPGVEGYFQEARHTAAASHEDRVRSDGGQALRRVTARWSPPAYPEAVRTVAAVPIDEQRLEFSWAGETARQVGILVHDMIRHIAVESMAGWDEARVAALMPVWRARLAHAGIPERELDDAVRRASDSVRNLISDDRAAWLLAADHDQVENEYELSVVTGGRVRRLRIDRTFVDGDGVRWIVDYKTSSHEGGSLQAFLDEEMQRYRKQMESYADAFRAMGAGPVRLGLYFPLLVAWREWAYGE
ncbi:MAG: UvrD-helicase domain-containing protein [Arenicellales bacterium]